MSGIMNMFVAAKTTIATAVDAFFNLTTLLLNTSSTNGAQNNTFLDSSTNNFTITRNGNTTQGTFTPFSQTGWSNRLSSSNNLSSPSNAGYQFDSGDFTVEAWIYFNSVANAQFLSIPVAGALYWQLYAGALDFGNNAGGSVQASWSPVANTWYHVAAVRNGSTFTSYVNGSVLATGSAFNVTATGTLQVGYGGAGSFDGYMSNVRIVKGTAVYTSTFTPPTAPLTAISGTQLLICQSNRFADSSTNALTLTVNGTPSVQAFSPFNPTAAYDAAVVGGSGYFDGTGDYLGFTGPTIGTGAFCLEAWVYCTSTFSNQAIFGADGTTNNISVLINNSTTISIDQYGVSGSNFTVAGMNLNAWNHIALSRNGSSVATVFINGVRSSTGTATLSNNYATFNSIGRFASSDTRSPTGYISGVRATIGSTPYDPTQTTCTVPTAPPTAITNTQFLVNYTNAGIFDSTAKNVLETVGNAQVSTTQAKWGTTSLYCSATNGNYFVGPASQLHAFRTGNFTFECWAYPTAFTNNPSGLFFRGIEGTNNTAQWGIELNSSGTASWIWNDTSRFSSSSNLSTNAWTHIAVVRNNGTLTMYFNGTSVGSYSSTNDDITDASNAKIWVGTNNQIPGSRQFIGYIDDPRITTGYARYTANFTAPTAAFPLQ
jgi:hypothetical protein